MFIPDDDKTVSIKMNNGAVIFFGHQADAREKIEDMIAEKLGFYPSFQEITDEGEFLLFLTQDNEHLVDENWIKLRELDITEQEYRTTKAVKKLLGIDIFVLN